MTLKSTHPLPPSILWLVKSKMDIIKRAFFLACTNGCPLQCLVASITSKQSVICPIEILLHAWGPIPLEEVFGLTLAFFLKSQKSTHEKTWFHIWRSHTTQEPWNISLIVGTFSRLVILVIRAARQCKSQWKELILEGIDVQLYPRVNMVVSADGTYLCAPY